MTGIAAPCQSPGPQDICDAIRDLIRKLVFQKKDDTGVRGLRERIIDQIYGKHGPGTKEWEGHDIAITQIKNQIANLMEEYIKNNCGGPGGLSPVGADAKYWINRPNPTPDEWKGAKAESQSSVLDWEYWEKLTGLTGIALVIYLLISEGSRVFPPRNLVPVP
jgi:hypothetical protein